MPNALSIDEVSAAMLKLGKASLPELYKTAVDVAEIGDSDFTDKGELILRSPSVRFRFAGAKFDPARDTMALTYNGGLQYMALVYEENLRSRDEERRATQRLLGVVLECFTGARLTLEGGGKPGPIRVISVEPVMTEDSVIDQYYAATFLVPGIAQFSGENSNFGGSNT